MLLSPIFDSFTGKSIYPTQAEINCKTFLFLLRAAIIGFARGAMTSFGALASSAVVNIVEDKETRELAVVVIVFNNELHFVFKTQDRTISFTRKRRRFNAAMPSFAWVMNNIAKNHIVKGSLVAANMVLAISEVCL